MGRKKPSKKEVLKREKVKKLEYLKKACLGKIGHKYRTSAEHVLNEMGNNISLGIYKCPECNLLHIGNSN